MSGGGAPAIKIDGATDLRVAIVAAQWHSKLMDALVDGAGRGVFEAGVHNEPVIVRVPGAFELPVAASRLAKSGKFDAIVCLGLVLRGGTPHFDYVCEGVTIGITQVSVDTGIPIGFGVLTCDNEEQAFARSGLPGSTEDKGHEAATAAIATAVLLRQLNV
jgi:6,7-dimethyl-8-ribityllumazine synthase